MGVEGILAMVVGVILVGYGLVSLHPSRSSDTIARGRGSLCRLGGGCLFVLGFLFACCPWEDGGLVLGAFGGMVLLLLLCHRLLWVH